MVPALSAAAGPATATDVVRGSVFLAGLLLGALALPTLHAGLASVATDSTSNVFRSQHHSLNSSSLTTDSTHSLLSPSTSRLLPSLAIAPSLAAVLVALSLALATWLLASLHAYLTRPLIKHCRLSDADIAAASQPGRYTADLLPAFPNTWYQLCDDTQLSAATQPLAVRALGRTFAISRLADGTVQCVDEQQRHWETAECNRAVFVWYDAAGRSSAWQLPHISCELSRCALLGRVSHEVSCRMVEIPENGADTAHLPSLHGPFVLPGLPFVRHTWDVSWQAQPAPQQHIAKLSISSTVAVCSRPLHFTRTTTPIVQAGPSIVLLLLDTPFGPLPMIETVTPITANLQRLNNTLYLPPYVPRVYGRLLMSGVVGQLERDLSIWNRKRWLRRPLVLREDGPILQYRRWLRQFFDAEQPHETEHKPSCVDIRNEAASQDQVQPASSDTAPTTQPNTPADTDTSSEPGPCTLDERRQSAVDAIRESHHLPALAAACWRGGSTRACCVYVSGVRKMDEPAATPALPNDRFILGSCTKAMTASLLALLIEQGLLGWDTTLPVALPGLAKRMHAAYSAVTVSMLCCHVSGLGREIDGVHSPALAAMPVRAARRSAAAILLSSPPLHPPGSRFEYSNMGFVVLGAIMEELTARSWEELLIAELFQPLGMASYGFGCQTDLQLDPPDQPWPHMWRAKGECAPIDPRVLSGANALWRGPCGSVHCSLSDWAKFAQLHIDGFRGRPTPLLTPASFAMLHSAPAGQEYTHGAWLRVRRAWAGSDGVALTHSGSNMRGYASVWLVPSSEVALLAATNVAGDGSEREAINAAISAMIAIDRQADAALSTGRPDT